MQRRSHQCADIDCYHCCCCEPCFDKDNEDDLEFDGENELESVFDGFIDIGAIGIDEDLDANAEFEKVLEEDDNFIANPVEMLQQMLGLEQGSNVVETTEKKWYPNNSEGKGQYPTVGGSRRRPDR